MIQDTSREIYSKIIASGILSKRRLQVYSEIRNQAGTACEILKRLDLPSNQSGRFTELFQMGAIVEIEKRNCKVTGNRAIVWNVTNEMPTKLKKQSNKQIISNLLEAIDIHYYDADTKPLLRMIYQTLTLL
jgi:hypothetical protein